MPRALTWSIIAVVLAGLASIGQLSLKEASRPHTLGVHAALINGVPVVTYVFPAGWAWDAGLRPGDRVLYPVPAPGEISLSSLAEAPSMTVLTPLGNVLTAPRRPNIPATGKFRAAFLLIAAAFALLGAVVTILVDRLSLGLLFLAWTSSAAICFEAPIGQVSGRAWPFIFEYVGLVAFAAFTVLLFAQFPVERLKSPPGTAFLVILAVVHAGLLLAYGLSLLVPERYDLVQRFLFSIMAIDVAAAIFFCSLPLFDVWLHRARWPVATTVVLTGLCGGLGPFILLSLTPYVLGFGYLAPPDISIVALILLPLSFAATMSRGQLFGIKRILRRGIIWLFVWTSLVVAYALVFNIATGRSNGDNLASQFLTSPFTVVAFISATFPPLERRLRNRLESALFQDVYHYPSTLQEFTSHIVDLRNAEEIAEYALMHLGRTLDLEWAALVLMSPRHYAHVWGQCPEQLARRFTSSDDSKPPEDIPYVAPLMTNGSPFGFLAVSQKRHDVDLRPEDRLMLATMAPLIAIAIRLDWQLQAVAERERELEALSQQLLRAQEDERRRLALELHDDAMQRSILLERELSDCEGEWYRQRWIEAVNEIVISLRATCTGLYPVLLEDLGLPAGLDQLVRQIRGNTDIAADLQVEAPPGCEFGRLDRDLELALFRVAQESLNNVRKHASAGQLLVSLVRTSSNVELRVSNDGATFSDSNGNGSTPREPYAVPSLGHVGMRHRLAPWDGTVTFGTNPDGWAEVCAQAKLTPVGVV